MKKKLSFIPLSIACILSSFHVTASENIIVDNQRKTDLKVEQKYGGEYIDIEKPNEKGISHNYFEKFNVAEEGVIINNIDPVKGHISEVTINFQDKNITLPIGIGEQHAKIIINEVTSPNPSLLKGNLFVMGGVEHLMLVNPYGIVCDGCSVTNASEFTLQSRNKADLVGRGAAADRIYRDDYLDDRIEIKNASQPMNMYGPITLDAYSVDIGDHNGQYGDNKAILAKKVTINSDYLSIYNNVVLNFDQLNLNITGNVFNYGKLNANSVNIDVKEDFLNYPGAEFNLVGKNEELSQSNFKARELAFDDASLNVNNADMMLVVDKFNSVNSEIRFKDSNVIISADHFVNKLTFPDNEKFPEIGGFIYLANSIYWRKNNNVVADGSIAHLPIDAFIRRSGIIFE